MDTPIIVIKGCKQHSTVSAGHIGGVVSGPDSTEAARAFMYDTLTCPECWTRDERALLAMAQALHLTPEETVWLHRMVMRRKIGRNRN